eukprot:jgi/Bigna1/131248/aug1.13_g5956
MLGKTLLSRGPLAVILAPTRELASQTFRVTTEACRREDDSSISGDSGFNAADIRCSILFGGINKHRQIKMFRNGTHILVTSPGRLRESVHMNKLVIWLVLVGGEEMFARAQFIVMDEADLMFHMGFKADVMNITSMLPASHQLMMFSATWPVSMEAFGSQILRNPVTVMIGVRTETPFACPNVLQLVEICAAKSLNERFERLKVHDLERRLLDIGYLDTQAIHSGKTQRERLKALRRYMNGKKGILVASDVAARGLDIPHVGMVVNFALPNHIEEYVHRIGRTGRAGQKGMAYTFFGPEDKRLAAKLKK